MYKVSLELTGEKRWRQRGEQGRPVRGFFPEPEESHFLPAAPPAHPTASRYQPTKPHSAGAGRLEILFQTATQKEIIRTFEGKHREG